MNSSLASRLRYNAFELALIKATFAEKEDDMQIIRKYFLQGIPTPEEDAVLQKYVQNPDVIAILKKALSPELEKGAPRFQTVDLFSSLDLTGVPYEHSDLVFKSRALAKKYLDQAFKVLVGEEISDRIVLDDLAVVGDDSKQNYVNLTARNFLLQHIDTQLFNSLMVIAGTKEESPEEQLRRLTKDSNK